VLGIFELGFQELFARGWFQISIILICASQVPMITGMTHQHVGSWWCNSNNKTKPTCFGLVERKAYCLKSNPHTG
jgi:hypothetical protein